MIDKVFTNLARNGYHFNYTADPSSVLEKKLVLNWDFPSMAYSGKLLNESCDVITVLDEPRHRAYAAGHQVSEYKKYASRLSYRRGKAVHSVSILDVGLSSTSSRIIFGWSKSLVDCTLKYEDGNACTISYCNNM